MSDRFHPLSLELLTGWIADELEFKRSVFGIPAALFFIHQSGIGLTLALVFLLSVRQRT